MGSKVAKIEMRRIFPVIKDFYEYNKSLPASPLFFFYHNNFYARGFGNNISDLFEIYTYCFCIYLLNILYLKTIQITLAREITLIKYMALW